jgi:hypothetical protein
MTLTFGDFDDCVSDPGFSVAVGTNQLELVLGSAQFRLGSGGAHLGWAHGGAHRRYLLPSNTQLGTFRHI